MHDYESSIDHSLPHGWQPPTQSSHGGQLSLFPRSLVDLDVTVDEAALWRRRGWLSFDYDPSIPLTNDEEAEVEFVRCVVRSGLDSARVDVLLGELDKPYRYDASLVAYSFQHGWVEVPPVPTFEQRDRFIDSEIEGWCFRRIEEADIDRMVEMIRTIQRLITYATVTVRARQDVDPE